MRSPHLEYQERLYTKLRRDFYTRRHATEKQRLDFLLNSSHKRNFIGVRNEQIK